VRARSVWRAEPSRRGSESESEAVRRLLGPNKNILERSMRS
jgi:hypothetical protein